MTPETVPLELFGAGASDAVTALLEDAGIEVHCGRQVAEVVDGGLRLVPDTILEIDRVVTMPRLRGPHLAGLAYSEDGFVPTDAHGLVCRAQRMSTLRATRPRSRSSTAASPSTRPLAVAEAVAARLGAPLKPRPFRPVLRGLLLTGAAPRFLWSDLAGDVDEISAAEAHPLWWPPGKIAGGRLAAYLHAEGLPVPPPPAGPATTTAELRQPTRSIRRRDDGPRLGSPA